MKGILILSLMMVILVIGCEKIALSPTGITPGWEVYIFNCTDKIQNLNCYTNDKEACCTGIRDWYNNHCSYWKLERDYEFIEIKVNCPDKIGYCFKVGQKEKNFVSLCREGFGDNSICFDVKEDIQRDKIKMGIFDEDCGVWLTDDHLYYLESTDMFYDCRSDYGCMS